MSVMVAHPQLPVSREAERAKQFIRLMLGICCDDCGERVRGEHAGAHADDCPHDLKRQDDGRSQG